MSLGVFGSVDPAGACSTFRIGPKTAPIVGKSYDWHDGRGLVLSNPRGLQKTALLADRSAVPVGWTSRYASLTFNQYGRELPNGGMNERGLVVEVLWLDNAQFPAPDKRPAISELQWIQYQLDRFASVAEMAAAASGLRVQPIHAKVHYFACDAGGECAAFEFLGGRLVVSRGADLPKAVLTNDTYQSCSQGEARGALPQSGTGSLARYARLARADAAAGGVERAFTLLDGVAVPGRTQWQIAYDPAKLQVHFRTAARRDVRFVDLGRVGGDCRQPARALDLAGPGKGDVTPQLQPLTATANLALVQHSVAQLGARLPTGLVQAVAAYPASLRCTF